MKLRHDFTDAMPVDASIVWLAVRMKQPKNVGRRTAVMGGEFEGYKNRAGQDCQRRVKGTGERVFVAQHILERAGFLVYLPKRVEWRKTNRYSQERTKVEFPALGDWLFVGWSRMADRWHELMALDVVAGVLGVDGHPVFVPERDIKQVMGQVGRQGLPSELQRYMRSGAEFEVGDTVRVSAGSMTGIQAQVVDIKGPNARILLNLLGRDVAHPVGVSDLEPVNLEV